MKSEFRYKGRSGIVNGLGQASVSFATNTLRETTFLNGTLDQPLLLREALAALYQVVVANYKYQPKDRTAYFAWLEEQDRKFLAERGIKSTAVRQRLEQLQVRISELDALRTERRKHFYRARKEFFDYVYENEYELSYLLDPVITVHPDEVFFEAFSRDESIYARVGASYNMFQKIDAFECGTTNIDFSANLHNELERMRSYRRTRFSIDPAGFSVAVDGENAYREKKIDLPESWLMGFLQVHSTMTMSLTRLQLEPVDLYNICRFLKTHKAKTSPRELRYELVPGKPVKVVLEPWGHTLELSPKTVYDGPKPQSIKTWGRDRLLVLERLIPICRNIEVYLSGMGMPTIYVLDLGPLKFTLALSGWTDNDWTGETKFHLLTRRLACTPSELVTTYETLRKQRFATDTGLSTSTGLPIEKCRSALSYLCQVGRAICDLGNGLYRHRDLFAEPFTLQQAAQVASKAVEEVDQNAKASRQIFEAGNVKMIARRQVVTGYKISGSAKGSDGVRVRPLLHVDHESSIIEASCTCSFAKKHGLTKGPCEHMLALRLAHMSRLAEGR